MSGDGDPAEPPLFEPGEILCRRHPWLRGALLNLAGDYHYLGDGYYRSLEAELAGERVHPSSAEALDAYVLPLALARGAAAGVPVANGKLVVDEAPLPCLLYPVNPFSRKPVRVGEPEALLAALGAVTRVGKYLALCQPLAPHERIETVSCLLGDCADTALQPLARQLFDTFRVPLLRAQLLVGGEAPPRLSAIDPLPWRELAPEERAAIEELGSWRN